MSLAVVGTIDQSKFFKDAHNPPLWVGYGHPYGWVMARSQAGYGQVMDLTGRSQAVSDNREFEV